MFLIACLFLAYFVVVVFVWPGVRHRNIVKQRHQWAVDAGQAHWVADEQTGKPQFEWNR